MLSAEKKMMHFRWQNLDTSEITGNRFYGRVNESTTPMGCPFVVKRKSPQKRLVPKDSECLYIWNFPDTQPGQVERSAQPGLPHALFGLY